MATSGEEIGIRQSKVSPKFLHANSTSHTWPFSAIAELIDNAYDPDVDACELQIDIVELGGTTCMTFADDGKGCDEDKLLKMLSFGFCEKDGVKTSTRMPIGHYGNGFKSGSMRIGQDAIVFTRHSNSTSIGFLSQTYLEESNCETVMVPIVTWDLPAYKKRHPATSSTNLAVIREYSPFKTEASLFKELKTLEGVKTGTKIFIFNLKRSKMGSFELDFESDTTDIRNPETTPIDMTTVDRPAQETTPEFRRSLREYCSILFLKPRMKIILRGQKAYFVIFLDERKREPLNIVFGFTCSKNVSSDNYGLMMYHKNRLIKAYEKVGFQKQKNNQGEGVVGVVEVNALQPIHNKQDFNKDGHYSAFITAISKKLNDYWNEKKCVGSRSPAGNLPDLWVNCDKCLKWRRLPYRNVELPELWFCLMNPDASHNRCDIEEEQELADEPRKKPTYRKTNKKTLEKEKKLYKMEEQRQQEMKEKEKRESKDDHQRKMEEINERIMQLENQEKTSEQQTCHLLKATKNLRFDNMQSDDLQDLPETAENRPGLSQVPSTSGSTNNSEIAFVENEEENDALNGKTSGKRKQPDEELIDLTLDDDEEGLPGATPSKQPRLEDIKPDKDELDQQISEGTVEDITNQGDEDSEKSVNESFPDKSVDDNSSGKSNDVKTSGESSEKENGDSKEQTVVSERKSESNKEMTKEEKSNVKELDKQIDESKKLRAEEKKQKNLKVSNSLHTKTKEKQIPAPKEKDSEGDCSKQDEELKKMYASKCEDLTKAEEKLNCLQEKVHKLLRIIEPDIEIDDTKDFNDIVDKVILDHTGECV